MPAQPGGWRPGWRLDRRRAPGRELLAASSWPRAPGHELLAADLDSGADGRGGDAPWIPARMGDLHEMGDLMDADPGRLRFRRRPRARGSRRRHARVDQGSPADGQLLRPCARGSRRGSRGRWARRSRRGSRVRWARQSRPGSRIESDDMNSDDEDGINQKACYTLKRLNEGYKAYCWKEGTYHCAFCERIMHKSYNNIMLHAETVGDSPRNIGQTVNPAAYWAKHRAFGVFLRRKYNQMILTGEVLVPPTPEEKEKKKREYIAKSKAARKARRHGQ